MSDIRRLCALDHDVTDGKLNKDLMSRLKKELARVKGELVEANKKLGQVCLELQQRVTVLIAAVLYFNPLCGERL